MSTDGVCHFNNKKKKFSGVVLGQKSDSLKFVSKVWYTCFVSEASIHCVLITSHRDIL